MTKLKTREETGENSVECPIDEQFVEMRSRHTDRVFAVIWVVAQIWLWCWYFLPPAKSHPLISVLFVDIACTLVFWFALRMGASGAKQQSVLITESRLILFSPGVNLKEVAISKENPVAIKKDASGKNWVLSSDARASKSFKVPCDAYPNLERFVAEALAQIERSDAAEGAISGNG